MTGHTPFKLAYGQEVVIPMEYVVPSLGIAALTDMEDEETVNERLLHLIGLEEDRFIQDSINKYRRLEKRHGMIDTSRIRHSRKET